MPSSTEPSRIAVKAERPYHVLVGYDLLAEVPTLLGQGVQRVALLHPPTMIKTAERLAQLLTSAGLEPIRIDVPDAEAAKSVAVAERCWSILGNAGFTRSDAVVGLGGGATTDLAGFVAATWLRGVRVVMVPTTLLGMVDAAVGGKTGINTAEGKNLVGCFHEPAGVICDLAALGTLPTGDLIAGLAEVVKCGFIADPAILTMIRRCSASWLSEQCQLRRRWSAPTSTRAHPPDLRLAGNSSTMGTPSVMQSSAGSISPGVTVTRSASA
jgi:3-dehydroquinate synthase